MGEIPQALYKELRQRSSSQPASQHSPDAYYQGQECPLGEDMKQCHRR